MFPELLSTLALVLVAVSLAMVSVHLRLKQRSNNLVDPLETVLLRWNATDVFTTRMLLNGGVLVLGASGSGKTSFSGKQLGRAIVSLPGGANSRQRSGGLIIAAKPEDAFMWKELFKAARRSDDLHIFGPLEPLRFNFLDFEQGGHARNIARLILTIGETLQSGDARGGGEDATFWRQQTEMTIYNAVVILKLANGRVTAPDLQRFILEAATSTDQLLSDEWRKGFHCQCLEAAHNTEKSPVDAHDCQMAEEMWLGHYPTMPDRTRGSIVASVMGILHPFNTGIVHELVSGETNISPAVMGDGQWVLVNMAPAEWGDLGRFVSGGWKYLTQRCVLRREVKADDCINVIWADEAQQHINSFDAEFLSQCRSHLGCMIFLSQSLPGFYAAMKGESGRHQVEALLANFNHTIVHAVDPETAGWAARKLGKRRESFFGGSTNPSADVFDELFGNHRTTGSFSEHYEPVLQDGVFMNGLSMPSKANGMVSDAIVIKSGEPFTSGENWLRKRFHLE